MKITLIAFTLSSLLALMAQSYPAIAPVRSSDDRELSRGPSRIPLRVAEILAPDSIQNQGAHNGVYFQVLRMVKNQPTAVPGLKFTTMIATRAGLRRADLTTDIYGRVEIPTCDQSTLTLQAQFKDSRYDIALRSTVYKLQFSVPCKAKSLVIFKEDSPAGQVVSIFQVIQRALFTLAQVSDFKFWDRAIHFQFPSDGDYYVNDQVHLTLGHQWDVVGHEMGHAIYDQAGIGSFGGGPHKIDECYSSAMALSEGWASYFSAWIHLDLKDNDAKFEFLVPRRAPIRIEHVPSDVCGKATNEWRVTSFLWDLVDVNQDGEISQAATKKLWDDLLLARASSINAAAEKLLGKGWDRNQVMQAWKLNFPAEQR